MDQTTAYAQTALAFLGRDAKAQGFQEAEALLKVREWLTSLVSGNGQPNGAAATPPPVNEPTSAPEA